MNQNIRQETQKKIMDVRPFVNKWKSVNKDWVAKTFCEIADNQSETHKFQFFISSFFDSLTSGETKFQGSPRT